MIPPNGSGGAGGASKKPPTLAAGYRSANDAEK